MPTLLPCRLCGYDAPGADCPHCNLAPADPALARTAGRGRNPFETVWDGLRAIPAALVLLRRTPRVLRLLAPPLLLTTVAFALLFRGVWGAIDQAFDAAAEGAQRGAGSGEGWLAQAVRWTLDTPALGFLGGLGRWVFFLVAAYLLAIWTFSLIYETLAGPFLDEVHARIEARWFGRDPRADLARPTALSSTACALRTALALGASAALIAADLLRDANSGHQLLLAACLPLPLLSLVDREYRRWLLWVLASEGSALWVSLKAACVTGALLVLFVWVKFIPLVGLPLFLGIAGFATALGLLDIPFSRRRWTLGQRMRFLSHHALPLTAFGLTSSALFVFLPLVGLLITVPLASVGGLWLLCRLDKSFLRGGAPPAAL